LIRPPKSISKKIFYLLLSPISIFAATKPTTPIVDFVDIVDKINYAESFFLTCIFSNEFFDKKSSILNIYFFWVSLYNSYAVGGTNSTAYAQR